MRVVLHILVVAFLTLATQLGGLAWIAALGVRGAVRRLAVFVVAYSVLWVSAAFAAPLFGRVPLPCDLLRNDAPLRAQSAMYCAMNRHYAKPHVADLSERLAAAVNRDFPGTTVLYLDAGFPFFDWFPILPHRSHSDGRRLDLAFFYTDHNGGYLAGQTASPVGYWGFEEPPGESACPNAPWPGLRWDMAWFQPLVRDYALDEARTGAMIRWLAREGPSLGVTKILLETHLQTRFGITETVVKFQGCRSARHDDHVHVEMKV